MGTILSCCLPRNIDYTPIKHNGIEQPPARNGTVHAENIDTDPISYKAGILLNFKSLADGILASKDGIVHRGINNQICEINDDVILADLYITDNFVFIDTVMSDDEIESFLSSCSPEPTDVSMDDSEFSDTERFLSEKRHISLCKSPDDFQELKALMENAMRSQILENYLDVEDDNDNPAVSVALLNSNVSALLYLVIKCYAAIPVFINTTKDQYLFLIYLAMNDSIRLSEGGGRLFLLHTVMKQIADVDNKDYVTKYFCSVDPTYKISLPHFLIELYLFGQSVRDEVLNCIQICIDKMPDSLKTMCQINKDTPYKIDVIGRIICLTNSQNVSLAVKVLHRIRDGFPEVLHQGKETYMQIVAAHRNSQYIRDQLSPFFN